jgi:hypothetical protein
LLAIRKNLKNNQGTDAMTKKSRGKLMWNKMAALLILTAGEMTTSLGEAKDKTKSTSTYDYKPLPFTYEELMAKRLKTEFPNVEAATDRFEMRNSAAGTAKLSITKNKKGKLTYVTLLMMNRQNKMSENTNSAVYFMEALTGSADEGRDFYDTCLTRLRSQGELLTKQHKGFIIKCSGRSWTMPMLEVQVEDTK